MKHTLKYSTWLLILGAMLIGCKEDNTTITGFESSSSEIEAAASGGEFAVAVRSDREWTAVADVPWVMVSPANGRGEVNCTIKVDSTLINDPRTTSIRFSSGGEVLQQIAINQEGFGRNITPNSEEYVIAASANRADRWFKAAITSNVEFMVEAEYEGDEEWLSVDDYTLTLDRGARPRTTELHIEWKMNPEPRERVARLHLKNKSSEEPIENPATIVIRQKAAPFIEDNRQGDSLAVVTIYEKMECWNNNLISSTESMNHWEGVRLWEATDKALPAPEAVGRIRDLELSYFYTEEGIPQEIKYLKYLETLSLFGNVNTMLKSIDMGEEVCELNHLKSLRVAAYGLVSLPKNFTKLGDTLEVLDLSSNNFNSIPEVLTPENFPLLRSLDLSSNRRSIISDLRNSTSAEEGVGLHINCSKSDALRRLLLWEELEELALTYNYIEGPLPDFRVGEDGVRAYTSDDFRERGDTLDWAVDNKLPRILPNAKMLKINLNFFNGELPEWLLYHPRLMEWNALTFIFPQQEAGVNTEGDATGFTNEPSSYEFYFEKYPKMRGRYEFNDEIE